jgi:alginate lyase
MDGGTPVKVTPVQPSPSRAQRRVGRRRWFAAVLIAAAVVVVVVVAGRAISSRHPTIDLGPRNPGYLASPAELRERAQLAAAGVEPYLSAVADLLVYANAKIKAHARPQEPLQIQGTEGPFVDDTAAAYGLALAWAVTGDETYARASAEFIMAWVRTTRTTVGTCPDDGRCQTSLIIGRTGPAFVFAADLLGDSSAFPAADQAAFREWLSAVILPAASVLPNNWGDAGTFLRIVATHYLGDTSGLRDAIERWFVQQDRVAADGHIPEETRRGPEGIGYTQEALQYRIGAAVVAERYGLDLWTYRGEGGATLWDAVDYLAGYWSRPGAWPWDANADRPSTGPFWEIAFQRARDPAFVPIIEERRPFGSQGHSALRWTTLTNGIPLDERPTAPPS